MGSETLRHSSGIWLGLLSNLGSPLHLLTDAPSHHPFHISPAHPTLSVQTCKRDSVPFCWALCKANAGVLVGLQSGCARGGAVVAVCVAIIPHTSLPPLLMAAGVNPSPRHLQNSLLLIANALLATSNFQGPSLRNVNAIYCSVCWIMAFLNICFHLKFPSLFSHAAFGNDAVLILTGCQDGKWQSPAQTKQTPKFY